MIAAVISAPEPTELLAAEPAVLTQIRIGYARVSTYANSAPPAAPATSSPPPSRRPLDHRRLRAADTFLTGTPMQGGLPWGVSLLAGEPLPC